MYYILLFIIILTIISISLRIAMNKPISPIFFTKTKPILDIREATYYNNKENQMHSQVENTEFISTSSPFTSQKLYVGNDLVKNIMKKDYTNIEYKTSHLGDVCETSKNCPDGLSCVFDGQSKYCAKEIPLLKCKGLACNQKIHNLGQKCGKSLENNIMQVLCNNDLKCMSKDFRNNEIGTCSNII